MRKLLSANFFRLWRDKIFWAGCIFMFCFGAFSVCTRYRDAVQLHIDVPPFEALFFIYIEIIGCLAAIFCTMFFGAEYGDGTIRNKLIVGCRRTDIYLSGWVVSFTAALLMCVCFLLSYSTLGAFLLGNPAMKTGDLLLCLLVSVFTVAAYVSIYHMLSTMITQKAYSVILCILLYLLLTVLAVVIINRLNAPEFIEVRSLAADGTLTTAAEPNPKYLQPDARKLYQFFLDFQPLGQAMQLGTCSVIHPWLMIALSAAVSAAATAVGVFALKKKDIK